MTEEQALLATIFATHEDDAPRLIYADWLDEHDQPERAEFIRTQIGIATPFETTIEWLKNGVCPIHSARAAEQDRLDKRWRELACEHGDLWVPDGAGAVIWDWHRGFVRGVTCHAADWLKHADAILRLHPVQEVRLATLPTIEMDGHNWRDSTPQEAEQHLRRRWPTVKTWHLPCVEPIARLLNWTLTDGDGRKIASGPNGVLRRMGEAIEPISAAFRSIGNVVADACRGFVGLANALDQPPEPPQAKVIPTARRLAWGLPRPNRKERRKAAAE